MAKHDHHFLSNSHTFYWGGGGTVYLPGVNMTAGTPPGNNLHTYQGSWTGTKYNETSEAAHNNLQPYQTVYMWERIS